MTRTTLAMSLYVLLSATAPALAQQIDPIVDALTEKLQAKFAVAKSIIHRQAAPMKPAKDSFTSTNRQAFANNWQGLAEAPLLPKRGQKATSTSGLFVS